MSDKLRNALEQLGLSTTEATVYLALLQNGPLGASAIARAAHVVRTSVYPILDTLVAKGLVEAGAGYGSKFTAVLPEQSFDSQRSLNSRDSRAPTTEAQNQIRPRPLGIPKTI